MLRNLRIKTQSQNLRGSQLNVTAEHTHTHAHEQGKMNFITGIKSVRINIYVSTFQKTSWGKLISILILKFKANHGRNKNRYT